jgi:hypothetical protein
MRLRRLALAMLAPLAGCQELTALLTDPDAPANLTYQLIPSGDPSAPLGVLLSWDMPRSGNAAAFNVYGRTSQGAAWQLRATTTSPTFHDLGVPDAQYYVATRDDNGNEIGQSNTVTIDLQTRLPAPQGLSSISLNAAIQLIWTNNVVTLLHGAFDHYRVYSTTYDGSRGVCTAAWVLQGTTVSDGFLVGNLANGLSLCFAVSAVTHDGHESEWSAARLDTPRYDGRNAVLYSSAANRDSSGFLFFDETTRKLAVAASPSRTDLDFTVERRSDGSLWITPARSGASVLLYASTPVTDLTAVDRAPSGGFGATALQALPGYAYVFRLQKSDGIHYAALRVAFVTADHLVFDWSYQSAPGNAELSRAP